MWYIVIKLKEQSKLLVKISCPNEYNVLYIDMFAYNYWLMSVDMFKQYSLSAI